jgi:cellulose biosynthesis protein BcsQ
MATILCYATDKGGAGKSTAAKHTGKYLHDQGFKVVIYDGDQSNNLVNFVARRAEVLGKNNMNFPEVRLFPLNLKKEHPSTFLEREAGDFDFVIIDLVGSLSNLHSTVMSCSHIIIVPAQMDTESVDGAIETFSFIEEADIVETGALFPIPLVVMCDWDKKTPAGIKASKNPEFAELPKFDQILGNRRRKYINASNDGLTVFDMAKKDTSYESAAFEMGKFNKELLQLVKDIATSMKEEN